MTRERNKLRKFRIWSVRPPPPWSASGIIHYLQRYDCPICLLQFNVLATIIHCFESALQGSQAALNTKWVATFSHDSVGRRFAEGRKCRHKHLLYFRCSSHLILRIVCCFAYIKLFRYFPHAKNGSLGHSSFLCSHIIVTFSMQTFIIF